MTNDLTKVWKTSTAQQLADALLSIDDPQIMRNFLRDVMTEKEIIEIGSRLEAAKLLAEGRTYTDIVEKTNLSSRTVARISNWMKDGCQGYAAILNQTSTHHNHTPPARAD